MNIQIINPIEYPNWEDLLLTHPDTTFFHTTAWARVLSDAYGYRPLYFTIIDNGKIAGLVPVMEIKSLLTGKRGVSLPFTDECRQIAENQSQFTKLLEFIYDYGENKKWKYVELRGGKDMLAGISVNDYHYTHSLELNEDLDRVFGTFKSNVRRNIKRAKREQVKVTIEYSWDTMEAFYKLNCTTRKQHGLPPQPMSFFKNIFDHIIKSNKGFTVLARHNNRPIAGAIYFHHSKTAIYKYGASDLKYQNIRPNNLVMWKAIKWCIQHGIKKFNFGRTEPDNSGLLQFKRGWGTIEEKLNYYKYDLKNDCYVKKRIALKTSYNIFRKMPLPLLRITGNLLYRHVG